MKEKILMAEDEKELNRALKTILEFSGYEVKATFNGKEAVEATQENTYDVIILDVMMPVMDGLEAVREMRESGVKTPIIMLTAKSTIDDKVEGLDSGANDYLTKPFDKKELLARIRAHIRNGQEKREKVYIGNILFCKDKSEISSEKASFRLNDKECEIMEILVRNQDRNITPIELSKKVWQSDELQEGAINMYISYLQNKFMALDANVKISDKDGYILEKLNDIEK